MRFRLLLRLMPVLTSAAVLPAEPAAPSCAETVVLLHGLARTPLSMKRLEWSLRADGYRVLNLHYPSTRLPIADLAEQTLNPIFSDPSPLTPNLSPRAPRVHIVTHSMGGILVRQFLHDHGAPPNLGRIVMLAPPNQGSELTDQLRHLWLYRRVNGPAGLELGTDCASTPQQLGPLPSGVTVGIIAGHRSLNPFFSALIPGPDDGKVSVARTHLAGETAHLSLPTSHTWMMWRRSVIAEVRSFLRSGRFTR